MHVKKKKKKRKQQIDMDIDREDMDFDREMHKREMHKDNLWEISGNNNPPQKGKKYRLALSANSQNSNHCIAYKPFKKARVFNEIYPRS